MPNGVMTPREERASTQSHPLNAEDMCDLPTTQNKNIHPFPATSPPYFGE